MPSEYSNRGAKRARDAREALGISATGPPEDLLDVVEDLGGAHVFVLDLPDGVAGAYIARPDLPLIFINGRHVVPRQRFTLAHEFGHFRMGHASVIDRVVSIAGFDHKPEEVEANSFAAEFLMPRAGVRAWADEEVDGPVTLEHVVRLAYAFGVSAQAARYALETAQVCADRRRCDQLDTEIADELHVGLGEHLRLEPLDDELAAASTRLPRIPRSLKDTALGDLLAGNEDLDGFARRICADRVRAEGMLDRLGLVPLLPVGVF